MAFTFRRTGNSCGNWGLRTTFRRSLTSSENEFRKPGEWTPIVFAAMRADARPYPLKTPPFASDLCQSVDLQKKTF